MRPLNKRVMSVINNHDFGLSNFFLVVHLMEMMKVNNQLSGLCINWCFNKNQRG